MVGCGLQGKGDLIHPIGLWHRKQTYCGVFRCSGAGFSPYKISIGRLQLRCTIFRAPVSVSSTMTASRRSVVTARHASARGCWLVPRATAPGVTNRRPAKMSSTVRFCTRGYWMPCVSMSPASPTSRANNPKRCQRPIVTVHSSKARRLSSPKSI